MRVVVEVAHHDDAYLGVNLIQGVCYGAGQLCCGLAQIAALLLTSAAAGPVVHYHGHAAVARHLVAQQAHNAHLVAGLEPRHRVDGQHMVGGAQRAEELRIVQQAYVHASAVGAVVVDDAVVTVLDLRILHQILQHGDVLYLAHSYHGRPVGRGARSHLRDGVSYVLDLRPILLAVPAVRAFGTELLVVFAVVVDGVEQVLKVIEGHSVCGYLLGRELPCGSCQSQRHYQRSYQSSHDVFVPVKVKDYCRVPVLARRIRRISLPFLRGWTELRWPGWMHRDGTGPDSAIRRRALPSPRRNSSGHPRWCERRPPP